MKSRIAVGAKAGAINFTLLGVSLLLGLIACEIFLRLFFPRYQYAAESQYSPDNLRIWARTANTQEFRDHPDTLQPHAVYHNNLALRQHRNFTEEELASATNLAFFGDSFTENLRLPAQYSFTEPLDYLLNQSGKRFNALNYGVDGYGTDQSFLHYRSSPQASHLDHVFYVFSANDFRNIYENNLFTLDESGNLERMLRVESPLWVRVASRFHLTYLVLDVRQRLLANAGNSGDQTLFEQILASEYQEEQRFLDSQYKERFHSPRANAISDDLYDGKENADLERSIAIFNALLREWEQRVEENGGAFYVVILPIGKDSRASAVIDPSIRTINLYETFKANIEGYDYENVRFQNDGHWNEVGNLLAAVHLYRFMEQELALPAIAQEQLEEATVTYYSSFPGGWMPDSGVQQVSTSPEELRAIREKYLALETHETAGQ